MNLSCSVRWQGGRTAELSRGACGSVRRDERGQGNAAKVAPRLRQRKRRRLQAVVRQQIQDVPERYVAFGWNERRESKNVLAIKPNLFVRCSFAPWSISQTIIRSARSRCWGV